jgi:DNA invertase Pin-like site-specific DNA recombinase
MSKPRRVALYARVSTTGQTVENQLSELRQHAERAGWLVIDVYLDQGISGRKGRDARPGLDRLLKGAVRREFDMIAAWSVDRLGRSLQDLLGSLSELKAAGVDLYLHKQALDTSTPAGKALFQMLGVFSEFEAEMIRERVLSGIARARLQGKRLGRPMLHQSTDPATRAKGAAIRKALTAGDKGVGKIARELRCGVGVVLRVRNAMQVEAQAS